MYKYIFRTGVHNCVLPRALTCTILYGYFMYLLQIKLHLKKERINGTNKMLRVHEIRNCKKFIFGQKKSSK